MFFSCRSLEERIFQDKYSLKKNLEGYSVSEEDKKKVEKIYDESLEENYYEKVASEKNKSDHYKTKAVKQLIQKTFVIYKDLIDLLLI